MDYTFAQSVISLKLLSDRLCEGKNKKNGLFLVSYQILHVLSLHDKVTPKELVNILGFAKSNLAIIAKKMKKDGLIISTKDPFNRKEIYYSITQKGKVELENKMKQIENSCTPEMSKEMPLIEKCVNILRSIKF